MSCNKFSAPYYEEPASNNKEFVSVMSTKLIGLKIYLTHQAAT